MTTKPKNPAGRPPMGLDVTVMVRVAKGWADAVDAWGEQQDPPLGRAAAIRALVELGLGANGVPPGLPYQEVTIDGRSATVMLVGKVEVTVFGDGEVRIKPIPRKPKTVAKTISR
jgi:hypothetical protein